jgi:hypothetical protein
MPRKTTYAGQDVTAPGGRIERLLRERWKDNQRRMAAEVGISQTSISKVVRGEQPPGLKFLLAVAKVPGLNPVWVLEGTGEPYSTPDASRAGDGKSLPVSRVILPGPAQEYQHLLTELRLELAGRAGPTMYALVVQPEEPVTRWARLKLSAGDYLLMDTDSEVWRTNPQILAGRLCAVAQAGADGTTCVLARAFLSPWPGLPLRFDAIDSNFVARQMEQEIETREFRAKFGTQRRRIVADRGDVPSPRASESPGLTVSNVVAYCMFMVRTNLF